MAEKIPYWKRNKGFIIVSIIFTAGFLGNLLGTTLDPTDTTFAITGLDYVVHILIFQLFGPILFSMLFVVIFPLLLVPLLLWYETRLGSKYTNAWLDTGELQFDGRKYLKRILMLFLLIMGLSSAILSLNLFDPLVLAPDDIHQEDNITDILLENPQFIFEVIVGLACLVLPVAVGLLSIWWVLEDSGLMHYRLPEDEKELFEIEPVHLVYSNILGGYAGISSIVYFLSAVIFHIEINATDLIIAIPLVLFLMTFYSFPAYLTYIRLTERMFKKRFRRDYKKIKSPREAELVLE